MSRYRHLIDYIDHFDRRVISPIAPVDTDLILMTMDKTASCVDMGFDAEQAGVIRNVIPVRFRTVEEVNSFPWNLTASGEASLSELNSLKNVLAVRDSSPEWKMVSGGCFGPLTLTFLITEISAGLRMVIRDKEVLHSILDHVTEYIIALGKAEENAGADLFWIAEPSASLLAPSRCREFCSAYIRKISQALEIPVLLHVCGNTDKQMEALTEDTGIEGISIDYETDLIRYLEYVPSDMIVMGNLSPVLLWEGTRDEIRKAITDMLDQTAKYRNYVFSTGCMVPDITPPENLDLLNQLTRNVPVRI